MKSGARLATREDVSTLASLMTEFYAEAGLSLARSVATRSFGQLLDDPRLGDVWLLEDDDGGSIGYLVLTIGFSMEFGGLRAFVDDFFVRPSSRCKGHGAAALDVIRQECLNRGLRALVVETGPGGHPARRLYHRAGFDANGRELLTQALAPAVHER